MRLRPTNPTPLRRQVLGLGALAPLLVLVGCASTLFSATPASAATVTDQRPFLFAFDGSDTTAGRFDERLRSIAVDNSTGALYVPVDNRAVSKFNPDGTAANFSATATSSLFGGDIPFNNGLGVAVDNSGGPNQGRLHVSQYGSSRVNIFDPSGNRLCTFFSGLGQFDDVAVDASGHPWTVPPVQQFNNLGCPPAPIGSLPASEAGAIDIDANDNVYLARSGGIEKWVGGALDSTLDPSAHDVYADQSTLTGHIFTVDLGDFQEFDASGALLGTYGSDYVTAIGGNFEPNIAYNPNLDRVYVVQWASFDDPAPVAAAFGPPASGTVPDLTIDPATGVGVGTAHFSGTLDPQGQSGTWHFEWKRTSTSWAAANVPSVPSHLTGSSPDQPLPAGPGASPVSFDTDALRGGTDYRVRLVTVNDADGLRSVSPVEAFTTDTAAFPPAASIEPTTGVTASGATVNATIDPAGDTAEWRAQVSTDPDCASGFSDEGPLHYLSPASAGPVAVSAQLTGLLPSQRYCVRIAATNSAGTTNSATDAFETDPIPPTGAQTAFVAPRLDTSVRLNGRVNPEGHALTYHFEWSDDDGATWTALPEQTDTSEPRQKVVLGQQLSGLQPETTYRYRFFASNEAGAADPQGEERTFTTRPTPADPDCPNAEVRAKQHSAYLPDCRAFELVNNPDKGNQDAFTVWGDASVTPSGERALWRVEGGAPGGYTPSVNAFLAARTPGGWQSTGLAPPPDRQLGPEYLAMAATPDFSRIVARARQVGNAASVVRLDRDQNQDLLKAYPDGLTLRGNGSDAGVTDDGAHVVVRNPETGQVEEIGSGEPAEVLSIQPDGDPSQCGVAQFLSEPGVHWIAATDASRVYFHAAANAGPCAGPNALWMRNRDTQQTTLVDPGTAAPLRHPQFIRAEPDGRSAYFATQSALDPADQNESGDVYRWDEDPNDPPQGTKTCLTCEAHPNANLRFQNVAFVTTLVSDDFSHVYFESAEQLTPEATPGHISIYTLTQGEIRFVADANVGDSGALLEAELSANGNVLVFGARSHPGLAADQFTSTCLNLNGSSVPCEQVYRYDDTDASLECVSCDRGEATSHSAIDAHLSGDGSTIAFATGEPLVPLDVNGGLDIYQWRDGAVELVTDGVSDYPQAPDVVALDADGGDLFVRVVSPGLTGFEQDGLANLYDARIGGGFTPPTPLPHCTEDSCQGPLQPAPPADQPGSSGLTGPGNQGKDRTPPITTKKKKCKKIKNKKKRKKCKKRKKRSRAAATSEGAK